jgi:HAD superfamily hydrolase (TIGR01509 family)
MIKAVLFDMDGVLSDSEPYHVRAFRELFRKHGIRLTSQDTRDIFGRLDEHIIRDFCRKKGIYCPIYQWGREKRKIAVKIMRKSRLPSFPGAKDLVKCASKKFKIGIGTSSSYDEIKVVLDKLSLRKYFDAIMGREDVRTHKPSPELYRKLAGKLKVRPHECIVVEDSVAGVEAAKRAKMFCIAVTNSFPASKLRKADLIVDSLKDSRVWSLIGC